MSEINVMQLYSVGYVQRLQDTCREKDAEIARLHVACEERFKESEELAAERAAMGKQIAAKDSEIASLKSATRKVVEAHKKLLSESRSAIGWYLDHCGIGFSIDMDVLHDTLALPSVVDALADPVIVGIRRG
jgi:hypothetical protein